jgi:hypothetical protein
MSRLASLVTQGIATGNEYLAGVSFGVEPYCGSGTFTRSTLSYNWRN